MTNKTTEYEKIWLDMQKAFSAPRIAPYTHPADDDEIDSLARYYWNMTLCEALYPALHCLEITLRNSIHDALVTAKGRTDWYDVVNLLRPSEQNKILNAKRDLTSNHKPLDPNRVIAELTFGFWTNLFVRQYDRIIFLPIRSAVFAYAPANSSSRHIIHPRLESIRFLRNRVFHHEPIWYWSDLTDKHRFILETIGWVSPATHNLICTVDRFTEVYNRGWSYHRDAIKYKLLEDEEAQRAVASKAK